MTAFNAVRFKVKPGMETAFLDAHRKVAEDWPGLRHANIIAAGEGRFAPDRAVGIRDEAQRTSEFIVVPARGLTLVEVGYPPDAELASRAEQTRAKRVTGTGLPDEGPID